MENGTLPIHLYGQSSINNVFCGPKGLNPRLISSHTLVMFFNTNSLFGSNGWAICICSHLSLAHTNNGLKPNPSPSKNLTMGTKLGWVDDDHIPQSNFKAHNYKNWNKFGCGLTSLFPHFTRLINNFHPFATLICTASHNNPLTSRMRR